MTSPSSLDVVEDAVRRESVAQDRRADAADTRAGFLLAFCGLVVSVGADDGWPPLALLARALAAAAGLVALAALGTKTRQQVDAGRLGDTLLRHDSVGAREVLLTLTVTLSRSFAARLAIKEAQLRLASRLVTAAVASALLAVTVETTTGWR